MRGCCATSPKLAGLRYTKDVAVNAANYLYNALIIISLCDCYIIPGRCRVLQMTCLGRGQLSGLGR